jgi:hypothetical protein
MCKVFEDQVIVVFGKGDEKVCFTKQCKDKDKAEETAEELASRKVIEDNYAVKPVKALWIVDYPILTDEIDVLLDRDAIKIAKYKEQ